MDSRRIVAAVFVAFCLAFSGLALHHQIAAHPPPLEADLSNEHAIDVYAREYGRSIDKTTWHVVGESMRRVVFSTIQSQLAAFRQGDNSKAFFYQTRSSRSQYHSAAIFVHSVLRSRPEFGHARRVQFGPLWMDPAQEFAGVTVTVQDENGRQARRDYKMLQEEGIYRIVSVQDS